MDLRDFFENMGLGLSVVIAVAIILIAMLFFTALIPGLLMIFGHLLYFLIIIIVVGAVVYFIGKFAKDFIRK